MTTYGFDDKSVRRIVRAVRQAEGGSRTRPQPRARWPVGGAGGLKAIEGFLSSALTGASGGYAALGILPTAAYLGSWGRDATTKTVWAVVNHNSDYAVIVVPEPGAISLAAVGVALVGWSLRKRRRIA